MIAKPQAAYMLVRRNQIPISPATSHRPMNVPKIAGRPRVAKLAKTISTPVNLAIPPPVPTSDTMAIAAQTTYFILLSLIVPHRNDRGNGHAVLHDPKMRLMGRDVIYLLRGVVAKICKRNCTNLRQHAVLLFWSVSNCTDCAPFRSTPPKPVKFGCFGRRGSAQFARCSVRFDPNLPCSMRA
jgi:hypothetical protein